MLNLMKLKGKENTKMLNLIKLIEKLRKCSKTKLFFAQTKCAFFCTKDDKTPPKNIFVWTQKIKVMGSR